MVGHLAILHGNGQGPAVINSALDSHKANNLTCAVEQVNLESFIALKSQPINSGAVGAGVVA